jgi:hypothetical protein
MWFPEVFVLAATPFLCEGACDRDPCNNRSRHQHGADKGARANGDPPRCPRWCGCSALKLALLPSVAAGRSAQLRKWTRREANYRQFGACVGFRNANSHIGLRNARSATTTRSANAGVHASLWRSSAVNKSSSARRSSVFCASSLATRCSFMVCLGAF